MLLAPSREPRFRVSYSRTPGSRRESGAQSQSRQWLTEAWTILTPGCLAPEGLTHAFLKLQPWPVRFSG